MLSTKDATLVYETLLMFPGMNDNVKIPLTVKRKTLLMLAKIIKQGINKEDLRDGVLSVMDKETIDELKNIAQRLLDKGGLSELNERLSSLSQK
ncbi:hypothetical protein A9P82_04280 [Arachidicoccus ginsenosidimutans]|uniref:hypothetical protein n=1 Tax=Arachidicoccus sp. BS20 TaxID=1850526 RepID=UPI0007F091C4|nr:hypothetical protein [Arachidicoccus sp. BS20]ANI90610.1 hypothetical protein A9P82_04280 [Arachidicoccus sp. BS20]